jgi:hypothetical protein
MALMALIALAGLFVGTVVAGDFDGWSQGRATFYGELKGFSVVMAPALALSELARLSIACRPCVYQARLNGIHFLLFTGQDGGTTIQQGSCMMNIEAGKGTGLDITAISDSAPDYKGKQHVSSI